MSCLDLCGRTEHSSTVMMDFRLDHASTVEPSWARFLCKTSTKLFQHMAPTAQIVK